MTRYFLSSCKNKARYPEASAKLKEYLFAGGYIDEYAGCCKPGGNGHVDLPPHADAVALLNLLFGVA